MCIRDSYDIAELVGASGVEYKMDNGFTILYLVAVLLFVFVVMFCGYLLIYNIFYISIVNDIRFFGMLKTIGTVSYTHLTTPPRHPPGTSR